MHSFLWGRNTYSPGSSGLVVDGSVALVWGVDQWDSCRSPQAHFDAAVLLQRPQDNEEAETAFGDGLGEGLRRADTVVQEHTC